MTRPRLTTVFRVGTSVVCLVACGLLVALWVGRYYDREEVYWKAANVNGIGIWSHAGRIGFSFHPATAPSTGGRLRYMNYGGTMDSSFRERYERRFSALWGFGTHRPNEQIVQVMVPHWFVILLVASLAAVPWLPWSTRFSLRTLLIVTTVVAVVLGIAVYIARQ